LIEEKLLFKNICRKNAFSISDKQLIVLEKYVEQLREMNKKINLISRRDEINLWSKHILGSISFLFQVKFESDCSTCDFGTGGGLPGIPLAILQPSLRITLVDSIQKKINAINQIVTVLQLGNIKTLCSRGEDLAFKKEYQRTFDYVVARAVAPIKNLIVWCKPLLKVAKIGNNNIESSNQGKPRIPRGALVLLKGGDLTVEVQEAQRKIGFRNIQIYPLIVKGAEDINLIDKKLVVIQP
jgi:16S rRNA (guanine527-N7)-methyltransferase